MNHWAENELAESEFGDARLDKRFRVLCSQLANSIGESVPLACQDWANTKTEYRFISNKRKSSDLGVIRPPRGTKFL